MKDQYILQIIYSVSQLTALVYCLHKTIKYKNKQLYLLSILLTFSFFQSFLHFFLRDNIYLEYAITSYILIEFFIHSSIIENVINKKSFIKYYVFIKYICIGIISLLAILRIHYFPDNSWVSNLPDTLILVIGIVAIKSLIVESPVHLLKSFEFWLIYSFLFIRLSLIPIEAIDYLFLNKLFSESRVLWIKSHQYIYLIYHIIIIYSLKWTPKSLI